MIAEVTSLADFFKKAEDDSRYRTAAVNAYQSSEGDYIGGWERAKEWIEKWAQTYVVANQGRGAIHKTCKNMVDFLNRYIRRLC